MRIMSQIGQHLGLLALSPCLGGATNNDQYVLFCLYPATFMIKEGELSIELSAHHRQYYFEFQSVHIYSDMTISLWHSHYNSFPRNRGCIVDIEMEEKWERHPLPSANVSFSFFSGSGVVDAVVSSRQSMKLVIKKKTQIYSMPLLIHPVLNHL